MNRLVIALAAAALASIPQAARAGLSAESARVLKGARGEEIAIVLLAPSSEGNALIRFAGTGGALDGMVLPCKRVLDERDERYRTEWRGRTFSFVQADLRGGSPRFALYAPPDLRVSHTLSIDEAAGKALKPKDVISLHEKQKKDGTLARFADFHRDEEQGAQDKELAGSLLEAKKACSAELAARVAWDTINDETLKEYSIAGYCAPPLDALASLCKGSPAAAALVRERIKEVVCSFSGPMKLALDGGRVTWTINRDASNADDYARKALESLEVAPAIAVPAGGEAPPWGDARTLGQRARLAGTAVCTDDKGHVVALAPRAGDDGARMYFGDAKRLSRVTLTEALGDGMFFEPRFVNPTANPNFRGVDVRLQSEVVRDGDKGTCSARCGTRKSSLRALPAADAEKLLAGATFSAPLPAHLPHALTRDSKGNYYYVDKGATPETARKFRLFAGPKGNLKPLPMTNVVADSKGEIFSTKKGELRLIVGPGGTDSTWVAGKVKIPLTAVPVDENLNLIYTDLGVYGGEKLGTPCDDL